MAPSVLTGITFPMENDMLETEIKKLNQSIVDLTNAVQALAATSGALTPGDISVAEIPPTPAPEPETAPTTNLTHAEVGAELGRLANTYGAPAQDAIKKIILETAGTQALSQVSPEHLPIIMQKVNKYAEYMEANSRG